MKKEDVSAIYSEANKNHDRVARNVIEIFVSLGIATSSVECSNPENVRRGIAFYDKTKLTKGIAKIMKTKVNENKCAFHVISVAGARRRQHAKRKREP